jgi:queuosine biosynthesis protein QueC
MVWNRESKIPLSVVDKLMLGAEKRGVDGTGVAVINRRGVEVRKWVEAYSKVREKVLVWLEEKWKVGSLFLGFCRARPETEFHSAEDVLQPLCKEGLVLVHNGAVSENFVREVEDVGRLYKVDSEAVLNGYIKYGMRQLMERIEAGMSFVLVDVNWGRVYYGVNFRPLVRAYVKGYGLILHSDVESVWEAVKDLTGHERTGVCVWEDYYVDEVGGWEWWELDLDSGMQRRHEFVGKVVHPCVQKVGKLGKEKVLVSASGGIDSGLSGWLLKRLGYEVKLVHFDYGQKGEEAERLAVWKQAGLGCMGCEIVDLRHIFRGDRSELVDKGLEVSTGKSGRLKTTTAWVSGRNLVFWSVLASLAEQELWNGYSRVYIVAGWSNMTEAGIYPDNSEKFVGAMQETLKYGLLLWSRVKYVNLFENLTKAEEWWLGYRLGFPFEWTCSCDEPRVENGKIVLCAECGSTMLSSWAARVAGVPDPRFFYSRGVQYELEESRVLGSQSIEVDEIVKKIKFIREDDRKKLEGLLYENSVGDD